MNTYTGCTLYRISERRLYHWKFRPMQAVHVSKLHAAGRGKSDTF